MIYCDLTLSVCTGRNLSVRVDRSTEVVGWHTTPDASNYICVSVGGGPPGFALHENNERHKSRRGRCGFGRHWSTPGGLLTLVQQPISASSGLNFAQNHREGESLNQRKMFDVMLAFLLGFSPVCVLSESPFTHTSHRCYVKEISSRVPQLMPRTPRSCPQCSVLPNEQRGNRSLTLFLFLLHILTISTAKN